MIVDSEINWNLAKFNLGLVVSTPGALQVLSQEEIHIALLRHVCGEWGALDEHDREANESALLNSDRLVSVYHTETGVKFYVITEWDRSATTVLLPEDY